MRRLIMGTQHKTQNVLLNHGEIKQRRRPLQLKMRQRTYVINFSFILQSPTTIETEISDQPCTTSEGQIKFVSDENALRLLVDLHATNSLRGTGPNF